MSYGTQKTLDEIIGHYVHLATHEPAALSFNEYAERFCSAYLAHVPRRAAVFFRPCDDDAARIENAKKLAKYFGPEAKVKLPAQLVPALIEGLPEPLRSACRVEVRELLAPEPVGDVAEEAAAYELAGRAAKECGEGQAAFLQVAVGGIGAEDSDDDLKHAALELQQAEDAVKRKKAAVREELERRGKGQLAAVK